MDISTLDGLLKAHVTHLSSVYDQLGASPETVPSKLRELHSALVGTIERQRAAAENELAETRDCIRGLESTIKRRHLRLAGNRNPSPAEQTASNDAKPETLVQRRARLEAEDVALERTVQAREKQLCEVLFRLAAYRPLLGSDFLASVQADGPTLMTPESVSQQDTDLSTSHLESLETKVKACQAEVVSASILVAA